jgi:hypothetical protein
MRGFRNKSRFHTSKLLLIAWILFGVVLLWQVKIDSNALVLYLAVLAVLVWNRIDSRQKGYNISLKGLGGTSLSVAVGQPESKDGRS